MQILGENVGIEKDRARDCSGEPSAERGFADADGAGDDQQRGSEEGSPVIATGAAKHVADGGDQLGEDASGVRRPHT